uniref:F-BAR domain only protein 2 n=1 Tax=Riptortus pedestris TaxID=329032 RepID=R4WPY4_RIPPE|nr:conserved hypothetical protein [Riptortus pedestris]
MTVDFRDYFWGEKNNGFDVLYHNMKYGLVASKELVDFLRERSNIEENNWKLVSKLAKQASGSCSQGTFAPLWALLRNTAERIASLHLQMVHKVGDLVKDVSKYTDELHKKHKTVKEEEGGTLEVVQAIQSTSLTLQKARDSYTQKGLELDKLKKESASPRELEKAEQKLRKAHDEYKALVEKYATIKVEFEKKMSLACKHFQEVEEIHLKQMKEFLTTYAELVENNHDLMGKVHLDFKRQCIEMTVDRLLELFVLEKYTGLEKPGTMELDGFTEGLSFGDSVKSNSSSSNAPAGTQPTTMKREGFLRSRREKKKEKKGKKKKEVPLDNTSNKEEKSDGEEKEDIQKSKTPTPEVDDEGYCVRPKLETWEMDTGFSFYSSSDTDSDEEREKKIRVEIKPISNGAGPISASVDELRATVENFSLSPLGVTLAKRGNSSNSSNQMKRSQSVSQQIGGKTGSDLANMNLVQSPTGSSASTPTGNHPYAPLQSPTPPITSASNRYSELGDLYSEVGEIQGQSASRNLQNSTPTSSIVIPRPPSRKSEGGVRSPIPGNLSHGDSVEFRASSIPWGTSRGPSPLTIGLADSIPLAVAFHEIIHSYFRGTDEDRCQVKLCGDMMVSFPAGIVNILTSNPTPAQLSFKICNCGNIENILPNKQLINVDSVQTSREGSIFEFNMSALTALLRRQSEQNPSASYFNVDILKYQIKSKPGAESCPLQLVAYWKREANQTNLKIDYKYNSHAMSTPSPLLNLNIAVPVDGGVTNMQTKPAAYWLKDSHRALWEFTELSLHCDKHGVGSLRGRFEVSNGPSSLATISAQFNCEGATLSGLDFQLVGHGYRISLVKKRFVSGKYICDGGDADSKFRYASTATVES